MVWRKSLVDVAIVAAAGIVILIAVFVAIVLCI
jgi:hypothetical protein